MNQLSKLDAAYLALGVAVMEAWESLPDRQYGNEVRIYKIDGQPYRDSLIGIIISEIQKLDHGNLLGDT
jgi:hypothetical protein